MGASQTETRIRAESNRIRAQSNRIRAKSNRTRLYKKRIHSQEKNLIQSRNLRKNRIQTRPEEKNTKPLIIFTSIFDVKN